MGEFLFIANDRALDFVNTSFASGDTIPDFASFVAWLVAADVLTGDEERTALKHAKKAERERLALRIHALRSTMRRAVEAWVGDRALAPSDLAAINAPLKHAPVHNELVLTEHSVISVRRVATSLPEALLYFPAEAARELFTRRSAGTIRRCANPACSHYFYDASKNGTRRWCSMTGCGNREKVAALRSRRRAG